MQTATWNSCHYPGLLISGLALNACRECHISKVLLLPYNLGVVLIRQIGKKSLNITNCMRAYNAVHLPFAGLGLPEQAMRWMVPPPPPPPPLGLRLVVEDKPTEFSCRYRLPNLNFCQYQIRDVSLNVVLTKITHYTVIYQLLMLIHVANILVLGVQIIMMLLCVICRRLRLTSSTLSSTPSLAGRAMRVFSVPSLGLG